MDGRKSKQEILKSTGILGSVQIITILVGVLKTKVLAILLGPIGVGITGIYQATISILGAATNFGIGFSGVREIASAVGEEKRISETASVIRKWSWFSGVLGMLLTIIFCKPLSRIAFNDEKYAKDIALLSVTLLLSAITVGMNALLQGLRRINDVALSNIISAICSLAVTIVVYYLWGFKGIVPALIFTYLSAQLIAWHFLRKNKIPKVSLSFKHTYSAGTTMAKLGMFMTITTLSNYGFMYVARYFIIKQDGIESVGFFIAAWTISTIYISAIFTAMSTDFYPRLSAVQKNNRAVNTLVNEQTEVALLLTGPVIIVMISFIGLVVNIFYSKQFGPTSEILNWQLTGDFVKVLGYPLGFVLLAKARGKMVIVTELLWNVVYLGCIYFGWNYFGIQVTGIAFLVAYLANVSTVYLLIRKITGLSWSSSVKRYLLYFIPLLILALLNSILVYAKWIQYSIGTVLSFAAIALSYRQLKQVINFSLLLQKFGQKTVLKQNVNPGIVQSQPVEEIKNSERSYNL